MNHTHGAAQRQQVVKAGEPHDFAPCTDKICSLPIVCAVRSEGIAEEAKSAHPLRRSGESRRLILSRPSGVFVTADGP
jgi:hypothetical protein